MPRMPVQSMEMPRSAGPESDTAAQCSAIMQVRASHSGTAKAKRIRRRAACRNPPPERLGRHDAGAGRHAQQDDML
jgi:hypothetical protein